MIEHLQEIGSTSTELAARLRSGRAVAEGDWLIVDRQTAGRGRHGREWCGGAGNFMGSTIVRLAPGDPPPATLALVAGLAVHEILPPAAGASLKWPNDLMVGTAKLAGILLEREGDVIVIGVGVNLAVSPSLPDRETVSLAALGMAVARDPFAVDLAHGLATEIDRWRNAGIAPIIRRWLAAAHPVGTGLVVDGGDGRPLAGTFAGLTDEGALRLRLADGRTHVIHAGEVRLATPDH